MYLNELLQTVIDDKRDAKSGKSKRARSEDTLNYSDDEEETWEGNLVTVSADVTQLCFLDTKILPDQTLPDETLLSFLNESSKPLMTLNLQERYPDKNDQNKILRFAEQAKYNKLIGIVTKQYIQWHQSKFIKILQVRLLQFNILNTSIICKESDLQMHHLDARNDILDVFENYILEPINKMLKVSCQHSPTQTVLNPNNMKINYEISLHQIMTYSDSQTYRLQVTRRQTDVLKKENHCNREDELLSMSDSKAIVAEACFSKENTLRAGPLWNSICLDKLKTYLPFRQQGFAELLTGLVASIAVMANVDHFTVNPVSEHTKKIFDNNFQALFLPDFSTFDYLVFAVKSNSLKDSQIILWQAYRKIVEKMFRMHLRTDDDQFQDAQKWHSTEFYCEADYVQATNVKEEIEANRKTLVQRFSNMMNPYMVPL